MMTIGLAWTGISLRLQVNKPTTLKKKAKMVSKLSGKVLGEVTFDLSDVSRSEKRKPSLLCAARFASASIQVDAARVARP